MFAENSHPAIITPEVFDLVQTEIKKRKANGTMQTGLHPFSSKIRCGDCGSFYGPKVWQSNTKYRKTIWRCNNKYKNGNTCKTLHLHETSIQTAFVEAFNQLYANRERLAEDYSAIIEMLTDTADLETERANLLSECEIAVELIRKAVEENARSPLNQVDYRKRHDALVARYETAKKRLDLVVSEKHERVAKHYSIVRFMADLEAVGGLLVEFDLELWCEVVESVTVYSDTDVAVTFRDGSTIHADTRLK